jgi:hypothetical protein
MNPAVLPDKGNMLKRIHDNFKTAAGAVGELRSENGIILHQRRRRPNPKPIIKELYFVFS